MAYFSAAGMQVSMPEYFRETDIGIFILNFLIPSFKACSYSSNELGGILDGEISHIDFNIFFETSLKLRTID